jgi:hypothetical protein
VLVGGTDLHGPALAKGVESATIEGPGLPHPLRVGPGSGGATVSALGPLSTLTAMWEVTPGHPSPLQLSPQAPTAELGPAYTVRWQVMTGVEQTTELRQDVYPYADGGPVVYTAAGQPLFDGTTIGGWYEAPGSLRELLVRLGVPPLEALRPPALTELEASVPNDPWWPPALIGLGAATLVALPLAAVAAHARRPHERRRRASLPA